MGAQERTISKHRKLSKSDRKPVCMSKQCQTEFRHTEEVYDIVEGY